jgi:hypothetical protein
VTQLALDGWEESQPASANFLDAALSNHIKTVTQKFAKQQQME